MFLYGRANVHKVYLGLLGSFVARILVNQPQNGFFHTISVLDCPMRGVIPLHDCLRALIAPFVETSRFALGNTFLLLIA